ncbi:nuclear transport factor 2 family protein [Arenibaculum pallidiluteum]|uniref:nuclear transport factor 2 family protein n=1 Tax=Arenibaculum pallidiluteum TaxID=2812559 RepID=UPI001A969602|nr:nuclear transport factor 2 family protein [Arenibaculum pallidiluteum]
MSSRILPPAVETFLRAAQSNDPDLVASAIHGGGVLHFRKRTLEGHAIRAWAERLFRRAPLTFRIISHDRQSGELLLTVMVGRNGRPGALGTFDCRFALTAGSIRRVSIAPSRTPDLPPPLAAFVRATNDGDLETLLATFAEDALVNDQLLDYWGKSAIRDWAIRDVIGDRLAMHVVRCVEHYGNIILTANVDGDFDTRGLPEPLVLAFYCSVSDGRIVQLIILRNQAGT